MEAEAQKVSTGNSIIYKPLYKKYFKAKTVEGFLTIRPWFETEKVSIDIGEVNSGKLRSNTVVWCSAVELAVYLRAVVNQTAAELFPANDKSKLPTPESFQTFGGGLKDGQVISRVLKIHHYPLKEGYDTGAFMWKAGSFEGSKLPSGAIIPDTSKILTSNSIKISRLEMTQISYRLDLALLAWAAKTDYLVDFRND